MTGKCASCASKKRPYEYLYTIARATARNKTIPFALSLDEFLVFVGQDCHYCGAELTWSAHSRAGEYSKAYYLDRKVPELGYVSGNCVVCCTQCNYTRGARYSYEEFRLLAPALREIARRRQRDGVYSNTMDAAAKAPQSPQDARAGKGTS